MPSRTDDAALQETNAVKRGGHKRGTPTKAETRRSRQRRIRNRVHYHEAIALARDLDIELAPQETIPNIIEKVINRTHALWQHAATMVDQLDPSAKAGTKRSIWTFRWDDMGNRIVEPSKWVQMEQALRRELFEQAALAQKLNIDEATVRIEAIKLELLSTALRNSMKKAKVPEEMQRAIGSALREELQALEAQTGGNTTAQLPAATQEAEAA